MFEKQIDECIKIFEQNGIFLTKGLTEQEIKAAEHCYNIEFPSEYRVFLSVCLPLYVNDYTDWRNTSEKYTSYIKSKMYDWTIDGILYTVDKLDGWLDSWGNMPESKTERIEIAKMKVQLKPMFIPICGNRFISICPEKVASPIYSIHQGTDVVCFGKNFLDFCKRQYDHFDEMLNVDLKEINEPMPQYNTFVYQSINNFFHGKKYYDEHGKPIVYSL